MSDFLHIGNVWVIEFDYNSVIQIVFVKITILKTFSLTMI